MDLFLIIGKMRNYSSIQDRIFATKTPSHKDTPRDMWFGDFTIVECFAPGVKPRGYINLDVN